MRLSGDQAKAFAALDQLIDAAEVKREGMAVTSFDVALTLSRSFRTVVGALVRLIVRASTGVLVARSA